MTTALLLSAAAARGGDDSTDTQNTIQPKVLDQAIDLSEASPPPRPHRVRLLGMQPGFLSDPLGLDQDEGDPSYLAPALPASASADSGPDWITIALGPDNPYLELRRHGDPGGVGYYRLATQVQMIDSPTTACSFGLQAFTPAGFQYGGLQNGPTTICPNLSFFQMLNEQGTALQGFVGNRDCLDDRLNGQIRQRIQYGLALQQPLWLSPSPRGGMAYFFLETLGRYRDQLPNLYTPLCFWEFIPGLSWRSSDNVWLSGGVLLPLGPAREIQPSLVQLSCTFQY